MEPLVVATADMAMDVAAQMAAIELVHRQTAVCESEIEIEIAMS